MDVMHRCGQSYAQATDHSEWSGRSVTLICGPPGSGKSTLARELHGEVLELEQFVGEHRYRLKMFGRKAWRIGRALSPDWAVVRGAASAVEREHHESLCRPSRTIVLLTPAAECRRRVIERDRETVEGELGEIDRWWSVWREEHPPPEPTSREWT